MTTTKNYGILYNENSVIFPVKAALNPYNQKPAYCAGEPQFFGGADEKEEGPLTSLKREVGEESLYFFRIKELGTNVYTGTYQNSKEEDVKCKFYCTQQWVADKDLNDWPDFDTWNMYGNKYKEMCWVATAPKSAFSSVSTDQDVAGALLRCSPVGAPKWAQSQMMKEPSSSFLESLTLQAFTAFVKAWNASEL